MSYTHFKDLVRIAKTEGARAALSYDRDVLSLRIRRFIQYGTLSLPECFENKPTELTEVNPNSFAYRRHSKD